MSSIDSAGPYDPKPSGRWASNFLGQICRYTTFFLESLSYIIPKLSENLKVIGPKPPERHLFD